MEKRKATNIYIERVEELVMENKTITIGAGATVNAPVVMAEHIENSFNALATAKTNEEVKALVSDLLKQVAEAGKAMPKETAEALGRDTEALTKEVTSAAPRRKWYEFTIDNIKQAAKTIGEVGEPILKTAAKLLPLLISLFP
jgi:aminoglycoside phosphotransferase family enzyme